MEQLSCGWNEVAASIELSEGGEVLWEVGGDGEKKEERLEVASFPVSLFIKCEGESGN